MPDYSDGEGLKPLASRTGEVIRNKVNNCLKRDDPKCALRNAILTAQDKENALTARRLDSEFQAPVSSGNILAEDVKKSQYPGVSWHNGSHRWRAQRSANGERLCEYHVAEVDAAVAYDRMLLSHGLPAINFPPPPLSTPVAASTLGLDVSRPVSDFQGVSWVKASGRWKASVTYKKRIWLDSVYDTELEAGWAVWDAFRASGREPPKGAKFPTGLRPVLGESERCPLGAGRVVRRKLNPANAGFGASGYVLCGGGSSILQPKSLVGSRVCKQFEDGFYFGSIDRVSVPGDVAKPVPGGHVAHNIRLRPRPKPRRAGASAHPDPEYVPELDDEGVTYYHVQYDDGDAEDIEESEVESIIWHGAHSSGLSPVGSPSMNSAVSNTRSSFGSDLAVIGTNAVGSSAPLVVQAAQLRKRGCATQRYDADLSMTDRPSTDQYVLDKVDPRLHFIYNAAEDVGKRPNLESTHSAAARAWNTHWCGGLNSFMTRMIVNHHGEFSPELQDVKAFAFFLVSGGTVGQVYLKKILSDLHCHWLYAHPDGEQEHSKSPFSTSNHKGLSVFIQALQKKVRVRDDVQTTERAALRPSIAHRLKDKAADIMHALLSSDPLKAQWEALLVGFRSCLVPLFMYMFGPRAVNAYLVKSPGGLAVCPETGSIIFYHLREDKRNNPNTKSKSLPSASALRRALPPDGAWATLFLSLMKCFISCREADAKAKCKPLPDQFFILAGEKVVPAAQASQVVTGWMKHGLRLIPNATVDMAFDETLSSHSLREGAASALYHILPNTLFVKHWFGWSEGSGVAEASYIKGHHWGKKETPFAHYFFGGLKNDCDGQQNHNSL